VAYIDRTLFKDTQCLENNFYRLETKPIIGQFPLSNQYKWFMGNGDSSTFPKQKYKYASSGVFKIQLELTIYFNNLVTNCKDTLSYNVTVLPSPVGSLSINDTVQCLKHNKFIFNNPDNTLTYFKWHFGDNDSSDLQTVTHRYKSVGTYKVIHIAFANTGCKGRDTVDVKVLPDLNSGFTGLDTFYCANNTVDLITPTVTGGTFSGYPMSGNDLTPNTIGSHTLTYILKDKYCSDTSAQNFRIAPVPNPYIGRDTAICSALNYNIKTTEPGKYLWNTGAKTGNLNVAQSGLYSLHTFNACGERRDTVKVNAIRCDCKMWMPDAFTPFGSQGVNDEVRPMFVDDWGKTCAVKNGYWSIYNRWGECVFDKRPVSESWNGLYMDEPVISGMYVYIVNVTFDETVSGYRNFVKQGTILVLESNKN
jgi:hypothetical protein